jgi:hypothetical protein
MQRAWVNKLESNVRAPRAAAKMQRAWVNKLESNVRALRVFKTMMFKILVVSSDTWDFNLDQSAKST